MEEQVVNDEATRKAYLRYRYVAYRQRDDMEFVLKLIAFIEVSQLLWWMWRS